MGVRDGIRKICPVDGQPGGVDRGTAKRGEGALGGVGGPRGQRATDPGAVGHAGGMSSLCGDGGGAVWPCEWSPALPVQELRADVRGIDGDPADEAAGARQAVGLCRLYERGDDDPGQCPASGADRRSIVPLAPQILELDCGSEAPGAHRPGRGGRNILPQVLQGSTPGDASPAQETRGPPPGGQPVPRHRGGAGAGRASGARGRGPAERDPHHA